MCKQLSSFSVLILLFYVSSINRSDSLNTYGLESQISKEFEADRYTYLDDSKKNNFNSSAKENCNEKKGCANGGSCLQHVCVCLPGTSGAFCEIIDDCKYGRLCGKEYTYCVYSVEKQKAVCNCGVEEYRFDDLSKTCKNCICSSGWSADFNKFSYCEYQHGDKICTCRENYAYHPVYQYCDYCELGKHMKWCKFDENGNKVYACEDGFGLIYNECEECKCGPHGNCHYARSSWSQYSYCDCDEGYEEFNMTCAECLCGKYGNCIFDNEGDQIGCECKAGYSDKLGTCELCYCGDNANCSFSGNVKTCDCAVGYHDVNGFCEDIDECEKYDPCDSSSVCINTVGSHKCVCAEGYQIKTIIRNNEEEIKSCEDIDECKNPDTCFMQNSVCLNTVGSFACVCNLGFFSRGGIASDMFCERTADESIYNTVTWVTISVLLLLLGFYIFTKIRRPTSRSYSQELILD